MTTLKRKWLFYATFGLVLVGAGISVIGEANRLRIVEADFWNWFLVGLMGLVLFNAGLSFFGQAIRWRVMMDSAKEK